MWSSDDERGLNTGVIARTPGTGRRLLAIGGWACLCLGHDLACAESGEDLPVWGLGRERMPVRGQRLNGNPQGRMNMRAARRPQGFLRDGMHFLRHDLSHQAR